MNSNAEMNGVWQKVLLARHPKRPTSRKLIEYLICDFVELHGDRLYGDDQSIIGGIGFLDSIKVTVIAQEKGSSTEEKLKRNFGMVHPEGYRKVLRLVKQAEKFGRPIIFIVDTPGAYPGVGAEARGQANAIATNLQELISVKVPVISVVLGEGGSGGALAMGVADEIWMFENAVYSILSPEGFASILYKDASKAKDVAPLMKLLASDLFDYGIVEKVIPEHEQGLHHDHEYSFGILKKELVRKIKELKQLPVQSLLERRYHKFRSIGVYYEDGT